MKNFAKTIFLALVVNAGFVSSSFEALGSEQYSGEIVIGYDVGITGPYAATTFVMSQAGEDYWKQHGYTVEAGGKKYKVRLLLRDNKGDVSLSISNFNLFVSEGAVIVRTEWTPGGLNLMPLAERAKVPITVGGFAKALFVPPNKYVYLSQPSYPGMLAAGVKWFKEEVWRKKEEMKLGLLLWDTAYGKTSDLPELYEYLKTDLGVELLPPVFFPYKIEDFTPQLLKMKSQEADLIFMQALAAQYALLVRDARRLEVTPRAALMSTLWCLSDTFLGIAGEAAEGAYGLWHWNVAETEDTPSYPVIRKLRDCMEKYRGNRYYDVNYFQGWMGQYIHHHVIVKAIERYGFPITGEQVAQTLSELPAWDWGLSRSFSGYAGGDRLGWHEVRVFQVRQGKIVPVSDWLPEPEEFLRRAPWIIGK